MPVDVYLIDYDGRTPIIDRDGDHNARLRELGRVTQWVSRQLPAVNNKILVGPECFFGDVPVVGYGNWWRIDEELGRLSRRFRNVFIVPGSMLWRMRGRGGNVCPMWYDGRKVRDIYKTLAAGVIDGFVGYRGPAAAPVIVPWRDRSFGRRRRRSSIFPWENYNIGVEICNDSRQGANGRGIVSEDAQGNNIRPDFHIVPSRHLWLDTPAVRGGNILGGANPVNIDTNSPVADNGYVVQCEGSGDFNAGAAGILPVIYPAPAGGNYAPTFPNPLPGGAPNQNYYRWRKLVVYRKQPAPNNPPFVPVMPDGFRTPAGAATTYILKVVYWLNL